MIPETAEALTTQRRNGLRLDGAEWRSRTGDRPVIALSGDLADVTRAAWQAIEAANAPPFLFHFGSAPVRLEHADTGALVTRVLTPDRTRYVLARVGQFLETPKRRGSAPREVFPPLPVVHDVLAKPEPPLPNLVSVVEVPVLTKAGQIRRFPGYDPAAGVYYEPPAGFVLPDVPEHPTPAQVAAAVDLIAGELLGDFMFPSLTERAHAVGLFVLPFVRECIDGPTPLHLLEAPCPGTGKTLLVTVLLAPALGRPPALMAHSQRQVELVDHLNDLRTKGFRILESQVGLSREERDVLASLREDAERLAVVQSQRLTDEEKAVELLRIQVEQSSRLRVNFEKTDAIAGLQKGFKDLAKESGETMQDFARNAGRSMTQALDDTFFSVVTGKFKNLGQNLATSLLRSITGAASELATSSLFGALGGRGGLRNYGGALMAVPTAAGGVMLVPEGAAAAGVPGMAGYSANIGAAPPGNGIMDLAVGGIGSILQSLGYTGFGVAGSSAAENAAIASLYATYAGSTELASAGIEAGGVGAAAAGVSASTVLGVGAAGIGFLASLYGAYQTRSAGYGALTGALGGAVTGATIGSIYPGIGTGIGAVVGLIAGAALGAGAGSLGGKDARRGGKANEVSLAQSSQSAQNYAAALNAAESGSELLDVLNGNWSPHGELVIIASASDGSQRYPSLGRPFVYADLFDLAIQSSIEVKIGATGAGTTNDQLTKGTRDKTLQIVQAEGGILAAYRETGPGLTRTTYTPFGAAIRSPLSGQSFFFSTETARNMGASDASIASIIREFTRVNTQQDILPDLTAERFLQL